jgi:two-component system LytT family response regulator
MKIRTLIVDDEPLARMRIRDLLKHESDVEIIGESGNGLEAVSTIQDESPDLIFLDVQMPEMDGFEVLKTVSVRKMPQVIFVTAYDQYTLRAFEVHALDYLLKPFDRPRFEKALNRAKEYIHLKKNDGFNHRLRELLQEVKSESKYVDRFIIKSEGRIFFLKSSEIDWIEAAGNYVTIHTGSDAYTQRETMGGLEKKLDPKKFMRIHRSKIVNIDRIKEMKPWFRGEYVIVLKDRTELTLSRKYREKLKALFKHSF